MLRARPCARHFTLILTTYLLPVETVETADHCRGGIVVQSRGSSNNSNRSCVLSEITESSLARRAVMVLWCFEIVKLYDCLRLQGSVCGPRRGKTA